MQIVVTSAYGRLSPFASGQSMTALPGYFRTEWLHPRPSDSSAKQSRSVSPFELTEQTRESVDEFHALQIGNLQPSCPSLACYIIEPNRHYIAATQLAVDCKIEQCEVTPASFDLELRPNGPDAAIANGGRRVRIQRKRQG
jgi:hypothetical protein